MQLVSFLEPLTINFQRSTGNFVINFEGHKPYLISNSHFNSLAKELQAAVFKRSVYDPRLMNFNVYAAPKGAQVLYYNGSGGYGDQILSWPVVRLLSQMGFEVHVLAELGLEQCWWHFPFVKSIIPSPTQQAAFELFKHHAFLEAVVNFDEHADQRHPVDVQLHRFGIDPDSIDPALKCLAPVFTPGEREKGFQIREGAKQLGIYQLESTSPTRNVGQSQTLTILDALARESPHVSWVALYDGFVNQKLVEEAKALGRKNIRVVCFQSLRILWSLVANADVVVGPDSMLIHVAGTMGTPAVGLWGPMQPSARVKYYKNHTPIWHQARCQFSPCYISTHQFPSFCPPTPEPRTTCAVLGALTWEEVVHAVQRVVG